MRLGFFKTNSKGHTDEAARVPRELVKAVTSCDAAPTYEDAPQWETPKEATETPHRE